MSFPIISLILGCLVLLLGVAHARNILGKESWQDPDLVTALPGQPPVKFRHYAGYIGVGNRQEKALFYWFFEAEQSPDEKPLVLWLNGGPGCSSVAYGAAQELGPFLVRSNGPNITLNPFAWNKAANLLFLEAPVGVGFSYTNRSSDLRKLGDRVTAEDSYSFLLSWFRRFPRFKSHDFYIAGESYAGHYVPQLAERICEGNKAAKQTSLINLKGFMIGNAVLNDATDQMGMVEYAWSHAIISDQLHAIILKECGSFQEDGDPPIGPGCSPALRAFLQEYSEIDIYSIYTPVCLSSLDRSRRRNSRLVAAPLLFSQQELWRRMNRVAAGYDPCTEDYVETYFNREDVQRALHANVTKLSYQYSTCRKKHVRIQYSISEKLKNNRLFLNKLTPDGFSEVIEKWNDSPATVLPILRRLMDAGLRVWIYSGDTDGRVPVTSTRYSINELRLKAKQDKTKGTKKEWGGWRAWYHKEQVAGWVVEYEEGLSLVTVRGAGHQVPIFAADRSLALFSHFLHGRTLPADRFDRA